MGAAGGFPSRPEARRERVQLCFGKSGSPGPFFVSFPSQGPRGLGGQRGRGVWARRRSGGRTCRNPPGFPLRGHRRGARRDAHSQSPPPRETRQLRSPCPLALRLLPPERTLKVLRPSIPPRIKGFARASERRLKQPPPQFLIPAIDGVAAEPAGQQGRAEPRRAPPPRHPDRTKARQAPNPRPALAPWYRSQLSRRKENTER